LERGDYFDSYSGKNLQPNRAELFFKKYLSKWPKIRGQKEKLLLIDWRGIVMMELAFEQSNSNDAEMSTNILV
jgi:hypothetical protein